MKTDLLKKGRCPTCTLIPPCKHYKSQEECQLALQSVLSITQNPNINTIQTQNPGFDGRVAILDVDETVSNSINANAVNISQYIKTPEIGKKHNFYGNPADSSQNDKANKSYSGVQKHVLLTQGGYENLPPLVAKKGPQNYPIQKMRSDSSKLRVINIPYQ